MKEESEKTASVSASAGQFSGGLSVKRANIFYLWYTALSLILTSFKIPGLPMTWVVMTVRLF